MLVVNKEGYILSLPVPQEISKKIVIPGYETVEDLHITVIKVLFDNSSEELTDKYIRKSLVTSVFKMGLPPSKGKIVDINRYNGLSDGTRDAIVLDVSIIDLHLWREMFIELLYKDNILVSNMNTFSPHITIAYVLPEEELELSHLYKFDMFNKEIDFGSSEIRVDNEIFSLNGW